MYYIKKITMLGHKVEPSVLMLNKGVNILYGPSDTGKSYVAECIDYMMGNSDTRIDMDKGYDTILLEMDVNGQFLSMERKLGDNKIFVISEVNGIDSDEYLLDGKKRICHVWLKLMGINEKHRISNSAHFQREELNNRAFDHSFIIREKYIYSEDSVLLPSQKARSFVAKSALLFLMTGEDFDDGNDYDKPDIHKAKKAAVTEFADAQLHALQDQETELKEITGIDTPVQIEQRISELLKEIDYTESEIRSVIEQSKEVGQKVYSLEDEITEKKVLQNRYKALQTQYRSDLKRLTFMVEGEIRQKDYIMLAPKECPFCGSDIKEDLVDASCIDAASAEIEKLKPKMMDLKSVQKSLQRELETAQNERDNLCEVMNSLDMQIQRELQPKVEKLRETLSQYALVLTNHSKISALSRAQNTIRDNLIEFESIPEPPHFPIKDYFDDTFMMRFNKILSDILLACKFEKYRDSHFDWGSFDVVINNTKKKSRGQGFRAFINVVVSMAIQEYLKKYGKYHPDIFVVDSPILSLKEEKEVKKSSLANESMRAALFKYFIEHPCAEQIIIVENEVPEEVDYSSVNMIKYTKENGFWKTSPLEYSE